MDPVIACEYAYKNGFADGFDEGFAAGKREGVKYIDAEWVIDQLKEYEDQCLKAFEALGDNKDTAEGYIINARRGGIFLSRLVVEKAASGAKMDGGDDMRKKEPE